MDRKAERFWARVAKSDGCWLWTGFRTPTGYGRCTFGGRTGVVAARVAWELANGPIPAGQVVRHLCHNPPCVRPDHLLLGTPAENIQDSVRAGRHTFGERSGNAKLTEADVVVIRREHAAGHGSSELGRRYGVTEALIRQVCKGLGWKHVPIEVSP